MCNGDLEPQSLHATHWGNGHERYGGVGKEGSLHPPTATSLHDKWHILGQPQPQQLVAQQLLHPHLIHLQQLIHLQPRWTTGSFSCCIHCLTQAETWRGCLWRAGCGLRVDHWCPGRRGRGSSWHSWRRRLWRRHGFGRRGKHSSRNHGSSQGLWRRWGSFGQQVPDVPTGLHSRFGETSFAGCFGHELGRPAKGTSNHQHIRVTHVKWQPGHDLILKSCISHWLPEPQMRSHELLSKLLVCLTTLASRLQKLKEISVTIAVATKTMFDTPWRSKWPRSHTLRLGRSRHHSHKRPRRPTMLRFDVAVGSKSKQIEFRHIANRFRGTCLSMLTERPQVFSQLTGNAINKVTGGTTASPVLGMVGAAEDAGALWRWPSSEDDDSSTWACPRWGGGCIMLPMPANIGFIIIAGFIIMGFNIICSRGWVRARLWSRPIASDP